MDSSSSSSPSFNKLSIQVFSGKREDWIYFKAKCLGALQSQKLNLLDPLFDKSKRVTFFDDSSDDDSKKDKSATNADLKNEKPDKKKKEDSYVTKVLSGINNKISLQKYLADSDCHYFLSVERFGACCVMPMKLKSSSVLLNPKLGWDPFVDYKMNMMVLIGLELGYRPSVFVLFVKNWFELNLPKTIEYGMEGRQQPGGAKTQKRAPSSYEKKVDKKNTVEASTKKSKKDDSSTPKVLVKEKVETSVVRPKAIKMTPLLESDFYSGVENPLPVQCIVHVIRSKPLPWGSRKLKGQGWEHHNGAVQIIYRDDIAEIEKPELASSDDIRSNDEWDCLYRVRVLDTLDVTHEIVIGESEDCYMLQQSQGSDNQPHYCIA